MLSKLCFQNAASLAIEFFDGEPAHPQFFQRTDWDICFYAAIAATIMAAGRALPTLFFLNKFEGDAGVGQVVGVEQDGKPRVFRLVFGIMCTCVSARRLLRLFKVIFSLDRRPLTFFRDGHGNAAINHEKHPGVLSFLCYRFVNGLLE